MIKMMILSVLLVISLLGTSQKNEQFSTSEKEYVDLFDKFKAHLVFSIKESVNIKDTAEIKGVLLNYIFANTRLDSGDVKHLKPNEISANKLSSFTEEYGSFYGFLESRKKAEVAEHLKVIPFRQLKDDCIYQKLTSFQKEHTLVYFDDRDPGKILGYMLFAPKTVNVLREARIWSWVLMFKSGFWVYKAVTGEVGKEYLFSGMIRGLDSNKHVIF